MSNSRINQFSQQPGGGLVTALRGGNALTKENLENKILGSQADYAPYSAYGDALSKIATAQMIPYQMQSQIMSNPNLWLALQGNQPAINKLIENFGNSIPDTSKIGGGMAIPAPSQRSQGLLGALLSKLQMGHEQEQSQGSQGGGNALMQPPASSSPQGTGSPTNPLVPATGSGAAAVAGNAVAKGLENPHPFGVLTANPAKPGETISTPTQETTQKGQTALLASNRVAPLLENLMSEYKNFYTLKGIKDIGAGGLANFLNIDEKTARKLGVDPDVIGDLDIFKSDLNTAIIDTMAAYGIHQEAGMNEKVAEALTPKPGVSFKKYQEKVDHVLRNIKHQQEINTNAITRGFESGGTSPSPEQVNMQNIGHPGSQKSYREDLYGSENENPKTVNKPVQALPEPTDADYQATAAKYGMTVEQVKKWLGGQ